ncbi:MAG: 1-acyl-sn-glycerol-3-phosphate acyltransferase [Acidimicrobiia bacterium]|nr:1-acyl-sn-glycerol-3-phosphate acyltransferase [Acidimicrobiia bacterium]
MKRSDRLIKRIATWLVAALYQRVEVRHAQGLTASGAQLANASHFGGASDPLLLVYAMDRVPRFIARDVIWKIAPARWVMNWVGAIPIHKPEDRGTGTSNDQMFASTYKALGDEQLVCIFPEGVTVDDPRIAAIKTGSARIALGARAQGVEGITLVSAGIHYQNKAALRSAAFVDVGYPIDLDEWVHMNIAEGEPQDSSNREAVRALTHDMEENLRIAAPDFEDWESAISSAGAASVALRPSDGHDLEVGIASRDRLARLIDESPEADEVREAMDAYQADLDSLGIDDETFVWAYNGYQSFLWFVIRTIIIGLVLLPYALIGLIINAIPLALVWLVGRLRVDDAVMATIKPASAILFFGIAWGIVLWRVTVESGLEGFFAFIVLLPIYLFALFAWTERVSLLYRALRGGFKARSIRQGYDLIRAHRRAVVEAVAQAV